MKPERLARVRHIRPLAVLFAWWGVMALSAVAAAQPKAVVSAALDATALVPSKAARLAVVVDVPKGFHAQSHTPLDDALIKCEVTLDAAPGGIHFGDVAYPKGERKTYPALGELGSRIPVLIGFVHPRQYFLNALFPVDHR